MKSTLLSVALCGGAVFLGLTGFGQVVHTSAAGSLSAGEPVVGPGFDGQPFLRLRPGEIRPRGWLRDWCETARDGYLGHLDEVDRHFRIAWTTNCMRRGELLGWGDPKNGSWSCEGGAYWFDGLVQFAWQMEDPALKAFVSNRLDTVLSRMHPNAIGFVHWMDRRDPAQLKEIESTYEGWIGWASAILGRSIASYYLATGDVRARNALNWAFDDPRTYEYGNGRPVPAGAWEAYRLGRDDKVAAAMDAWCKTGPRWKDVVWRYARTPDPDRMNLNRFKADWRAQHGVLACETALSALRMSFWRTGDPQWRKAVLEWSDYLRANCLQPHGVPVADESWGYAGADRGTETCTVAADLRLNEEMLVLLGGSVYGDRIEQAFFNAAAACTTADFRKHVYVQTPNRTVIGVRTDTMCPDAARYYKDKHWPLCCTAALTRPIPDFIQHAWLRSTNGVVAALYAPTHLRTDIGGVGVEVDEATDYPFRETVAFTVRPQSPVRFALSMRLPGWCADPKLRLNGDAVEIVRRDGYVTIDRTWTAGDCVELTLPMKPRVVSGVDRNEKGGSRPWRSILAGPLLFAANLPGSDENAVDPSVDVAGVTAKAPIVSQVKLSFADMPKPWRWDSAVAPVVLTAGQGGKALRLVPYGTTRLRISMFDDATVSDEEMSRIYDEVKTPFKYGVILEPEPGKMLDNPNVFRHGNRWYMLYIVFDKLGYETHLAESDDLLHWTKRGCVLPRGKAGAWDVAQADAGPSLMNPDWEGDNTLGKFDGRHWATYIGGAKTGYETDPLSIGVAMTDDPSAAKPWERLPKPVLTPADADARPFEGKTLFKSFVLDDPLRKTGHRFVMYYNAKQQGEWVERIGMAVSDDMRTWTRFGADTCLRQDGALDHGLTGDPMVRKIGDTFVMFYFGYNWDRKGGSAFETFAASKDLVNWTKWTGPKLVESSESWDRTHAHKPWVIKHDGVVYHFYCAVGEKGRLLALATSKDLKGASAANVCAERTFRPAHAVSMGATAHVTWHEFDAREKTFAMMRAAGLDCVRSDFHYWRCCPKKPGEAWNFSMYDQVVDEAKRYGITVLPILMYQSNWGREDFRRHEGEWTTFVRETARHFKGRIPVYEVCNEPNLHWFWNNPNPANYLAGLKAAYRAIKAEDPAAKVMIAGFAGVPLDFIGRIYALGGKNFFEIMNVHPYTWPNPPNGMMESMMTGLKELMAKYGDGDKPIWITEMGWPTHKAKLPAQNLFLAGLKAARPAQKTWRVGYVDASGDAVRGKVYADAMAEILPAGSSAGSYTVAEINELLDADRLDAVVYPFDESFPLDTIEHVVQFVKRGGVLVDFGGCPMWVPNRNGVIVEKAPDGKFIRGLVRERLRIDVIWPSPANGLAANARTFETDAAREAGLKPDPNGFPCFRFFDRTRLKDGDEFIPLTTVKDKNGHEVAGACVSRFNSDLKGALVLAGCGNDRGGTTEADQARHLLQAMDIAGSFGVEKFFLYEFQAPEKDPYYSEDHFGIVHKDYAPKTAYTMLKDRFAKTGSETLAPPSGDATAVVQGAIDGAFRKGGGTVRLGKGRWNVKALRLRSRVTLYLESGAEIVGSRNIDDYFILDSDTVEPVPREWISHEAWDLEQSCSKDSFTRYPASRWNNGLVRLLGAVDAAIIGEPGSVIDGMNPYDPMGEEFYRGPQGISAINCTNLTLRGYTIRNTGNWAHRIADTANLTVENVTCLAGHDGVHVNGCDGVRIENCTMKTGDDCIAGFDNSDVVVRNCYLNTACSGFRFAGTNVLIEKCELKGPAEYGFRGSLSEADKKSGAPSGKASRTNMLSFFTYYADGTHPVRRNAGGIVIRDCVSHGTNRYLHYNYGNEKWQRGKPMTDITFERVKATGLKLPICAWSDKDVPVRLRFRACELGFDNPVTSMLIGSFVGGIEIEGLKVSGVNGPLVRLWNADAVRPEMRVMRLEGVSEEVKPEDGPWNVKGI